MRTNIFRDVSLEVINASFLEEVCSHNVPPFVLPFNIKVGKLLELCGFLKRNGAAEKREHHRDSLYFPQILSLIGEFCNHQCIPNCIPIAPLEFSLGVARMVPSNIAGEYLLMAL